MAERPCTLLIHQHSSEPLRIQQVKQIFESGTDEEKIAALQKTITLIIAGEPLPQLLMHIIRFVMPSKNHTIKKLLLIYWEVVNKKSADGKLLQEMILVCNGLLRDLYHPNEYIRGCTLRFLCKLKESELLEPLISAIRQNLEHRHSYVRRNAVLCVYSIYKDFPHLIADAPDLILEFLKNEGDPSCRRNAFIMLFNSAQEKAINYLNTVLDDVLSFGEILQLIVIEMIKKTWRLESRANRLRYMRTLFALLGGRARLGGGRVGGPTTSGTSAAVQYEAALCLIQLSSAPTAIHEATLALINLLCTESDHNVKLVVLDRLVDIKTRYRKVLQGLVMDILRALTTPNMQLRHKTLELAMDLVTSQNVNEVVLLLKKEVNKTQQLAEEISGKMDTETAEYRHLLIHAIHQCAVKFPDVANEVVHVLMDFLVDGRETSVDESARDVIAFIRDVVETYPHLREGILKKLIHESLSRIQHEEVYRSALWIVSEYTQNKSDIEAALHAIHSALGELPLVSTATSSSSEENILSDASLTPTVRGVVGSSPTSTNTSTTPSSSSAHTTTSPRPSGPRILADGTYATETALSLIASTHSKAVHSQSRVSTSSLPPLRRLLTVTHPDTPQRMRGLLAGVVGVTLLKLTLRALTLLGSDSSTTTRHRLVARTLYTLTCLRQLPDLESDNDTRLAQCILVLLYPHRYAMVSQLYLDSLTRSAFAEALAEIHKKRAADEAASLARFAQQEREQSFEHPDTPIRFRHLLTRTSTHDFEGDDDIEEEASLQKVRGTSEITEDQTHRLHRIVQLTGFSDPLYAEAYVHVHQYDIVLDVTIINQTSDTLQGVTLELATLGDLKLCERPQSFNLGAHGILKIKSNIKVSSTETGLIFGTIAYDIAGQVTEKRNYVVLNEIRIDIVDYITPATCSDAAFRAMWSEFEWENKVTIHTNFDNLNEFLEHILKTTNMRSLTPKYDEHSLFLSANLYAKSIFGEDALANVSAEKHPDGKITGFIRIRSKTQGLAISLGDKINQNLKRPLK